MSEATTDRSLLAAFVRFDLLAAAIALIVCVVGQLAFLQAALFWIVPAAVAALVMMLWRAGLAVPDGSVETVLTLVAVGNWVVSLTVPIALPFMWPVLAVTAIVPVVLAAPYLSGRAMTVMIGIGAAVIGGVAVIGLLGDDSGVISDIDDTFELVLVVGSLAALMAPIGLVVTLANRLQRQSIERSATLNAELRASEQQLAASRRRVVDAADTERIRIERDLHDGAQQRLVALGVHLRLLQSRTADESSPEGLHDNVTMLVGELDLAIDELRELAHGIYPPLLEARGLIEALGAVARRSPVPLAVDADDVGRFDPSIESAVYFIVLEAVANVTKHAPESTARIRLAHSGTELMAEIVDDGPGFDDSISPTSRGMLNMRDRVEAIGGTLIVHGEVGNGTLVRAYIPVDRADGQRDRTTAAGGPDTPGETPPVTIEP